MNAITLLKKIASVYIPRPGFLFPVLAVIQLYYYTAFIYNNFSEYSLTVPSFLTMTFSFLSLFIFSLLIESISNNRIVRSILSIIVVFIFTVFSAYNLFSLAPVDFILIASNFDLAFFSESLSVILNASFRRQQRFIIPLLLVLCIFLEIRWKLFSRINQKKPLLPKIAFSFALWIPFIMAPVSFSDQFTMFAKSIISSNRSAVYAKEIKGFPHLKTGIDRSAIRDKLPLDRQSKPHVFLIMIESFNANFIEKANPLGIEYTPYFNSLIPKGIYVERFYGNSVQTSRGQEATFFSIIPSIKGKLFVHYPYVRISGFPKILTDNGYHTLYFQAYRTLKFDNTESAMRKAGFSFVRTFEQYEKTSDSPNIWGWGVEDGTFYERFFNVLDNEKNGKPVFAAIATISTHAPCEKMPASKMKINKNPHILKERYENALHLADSQLEIFFRELKKRPRFSNSIIIITSDHGHPMGEHGINSNDICFYDEAFRIPLLILWDGVISAKRIADRPLSQIDIGPTILDMTGITPSQNTLTGTSIFIETKKAVHLVQPYNGQYLETILYPYKYIFHEKSKSEEVFNLKSDAGETKNMIGKIDPVILGQLRTEIEEIRFNQKIIEENRFNP